MHWHTDTKRKIYKPQGRTVVLIGVFIVSSIVSPIIGIFRIVDGNHYIALNEDLEGSEATMCEVVSIDEFKCGTEEEDNEDDIGFISYAFAEVCMKYYNITIPWNGNVGSYDNCYAPRYAPLPRKEDWYPGLRLECRANCEKREWYTEDPEPNAKEILALGIILVVWPFGACALCCFIYWFDCTEHITGLEYEDSKNSSKNDKTIIDTEDFDPQRDYEISIPRPKWGYLHKKCAKQLEGTYHNSDGLLIIAEGREVQFLPSENIYKLLATCGEQSDGNSPIGIEMFIDEVPWHLQTGRKDNFPMRVIWKSEIGGKTEWFREKNLGPPPEVDEFDEPTETGGADEPPAYFEVVSSTPCYDDVSLKAHQI